MKSEEWPVNGLRHPPEAGTNGWCLYAGTQPSHEPDYFLPLHVDHLDDWRAGLAPYLALPGWRSGLHRRGRRGFRGAPSACDG